MYLFVVAHVRNAQVWQIRFWMMHFGTPSEKPTMLMGNLFTMYKLNKGPLTKEIRKKNKKLTKTRTFEILFVFPFSILFLTYMQLNLPTWHHQVNTQMPLVAKDSWAKRRNWNQHSHFTEILQFDISLIVPMRSRSYTTAFGSALAEAYQEQLTKPAQKDLRCRVAVNGDLTGRELFERMPMGDCWPDANMKDVIEYICKSSHCRTSFEIKLGSSYVVFPCFLMFSLSGCYPLNGALGSRSSAGFLWSGSKQLRISEINCHPRD